MLSILLAAGNTDPAWLRPGGDRFDITVDRPPAPLTFGAEIHQCLGAVLARAERAAACRSWPGA